MKRDPTGDTNVRMPRTPARYSVITPHAAAYVFRISDARLRRLALDGRLRTRTLAGSGWKPCRVYDVDELSSRWEADTDRLRLLLKVEIFQVLRTGGAVWQVYMPRPAVVDGDGELAVTMEDDE